ncbi:hypothetical protein TNCV_1190001 [Trichonephila clavipes]|nr:hypothetical protein TNCV_1190001 [Trichonephila clavipes]
MPEAIKCPSSTHGARSRHISGSKSLVGGRSRNHGCRELVDGKELHRWWRHLSCRSPTRLRLLQLTFLPFGKDSATKTRK